MSLVNNNICPFCNCEKLYIVSKTTLKCSSCNKKYSIRKLRKDYRIMQYFCFNISAQKCSKSLHVNYKSVKDRYMDYRKLALLHVENIYHNNYTQFSEYDEYYYLPKNKQGKVKYLFEAIGILGMLYDRKIYTLLLPDQFLHLRTESFSNPDINLAYMKEYSKYLNRHKLVHYKKFDSQLIRFWVFLERKLAHFKGIDRENFVYYLKEYEFKFNNSIEKQEKILWKLWIDSKR